MAKQKGGLGRGLSSLLGGDIEAPQPEVKGPSGGNSSPERAGNEQGERKPSAPQPPAPQSQELYSSKEDNVTIKGVVERPATATQQAETSPSRVKGEMQNRVLPRETDEIALDLIEPNPEQPRTNFKKEELEELAESIRRNGLLQPILVRKVGEKYQIIAGERRWQACKKLKLEKVPVRIKEADDEETIILALIENIQRSDLNPIEEAYGYRRMMERGRMTQSQVAQAVSKGRSTVANSLRLLELPEDAQQLLFEEKITAGHARAILSVPTPEGRAKLTEKLMQGPLSVRETEAIARLMSGKKDEKKSERPQSPKSYKTVARSLKDILQTDVSVKSSKGKNKIEIAFKDEADLERLFRIIASE